MQGLRAHGIAIESHRVQGIGSISKYVLAQFAGDIVMPKPEPIPAPRTHVPNTKFSSAIPSRVKPAQLSRLMPPPNYVPHRIASGSGTPKASMGGDRFHGPEKSPSFRDTFMRERNVNGYTSAHLSYTEVRRGLMERWKNSGIENHFSVELSIKTVPAGHTKYKDIGIVSVRAINV